MTFHAGDRIVGQANECSGRRQNLFYLLVHPTRDFLRQSWPGAWSISAESGTTGRCLAAGHRGDFSTDVRPSLVYYETWAWWGTYRGPKNQYASLEYPRLPSGVALGTVPDATLPKKADPPSRSSRTWFAGDWAIIQIVRSLLRPGCERLDFNCRKNVGDTAFAGLILASLFGE